ncbi:MAG: N-acetyl-gamma-glutamyl-phosphate reductase [Bacteroidota bacterium]
MHKVSVGIIGGGGYTAGELLRLLVHHPGVEIKFVVSNSQAGKPIASVHNDLIGDTDLVFVDQPDSAEVIFLCMGHGKSSGWVAEQQPTAETVIIDLSTDFRMSEEWVYGLPELNRDATRGAKRIANPGCFATAIQLAALPLAAAGLIDAPLHVHAITGSSGAGQNPSPTTHFSWRNNNVSIYKAFRHQHLAEINRSIRQVDQGREARLHFLPVRGNFARGIYASLYLTTDADEDLLLDTFARYFANHPFTHLTTENPHLKQVVNTNKGLVHVQKIDDQVLVISMIDNLLKGASGQAVQNMNLAMGLPETMGLQLKAAAL